MRHADLAEEATVVHALWRQRWVRFEWDAAAWHRVQPHVYTAHGCLRLTRQKTKKTEPGSCSDVYSRHVYVLDSLHANDAECELALHMLGATSVKIGTPVRRLFAR